MKHIYKTSYFPVKAGLRNFLICTEQSFLLTESEKMSRENYKFFHFAIKAIIVYANYSPRIVSP